MLAWQSRAPSSTTLPDSEHDLHVFGDSHGERHTFGGDGRVEAHGTG